MLRKLIIAVIALLYAHTGLAQTEKPDFNKIGKEISDKDSKFYYKNIIKRYADDDTTLSIEEYRYLYYGYSFQSGYSAYGHPSVNDELKKAREAGDAEKQIGLNKKALKEFPFNLRNLYRMTILLDQKGDSVQAEIYNKKMLGVARAIMSTGDGLTDTTAMYVISTEHEYDLIFLLGFQFGGSQALVYSKDGPTDKMKLEKNDDKLEYLYFNVDRLFSSMKGLFDKKN